jgi:soluble lytic murein transglycosylase-like protein
MFKRFLSLPVLAVAGFVAASNGAVASPNPARAISTVSELAKEKAMSPSQLVDRWSSLIKDASHRFGVAEEWIRAVIRMESGGRTLADDNKPITSAAGAMGIMQLMPQTYKEMRQIYGLGADPYDPHDNVLAGAAYLSWLKGKYGYPKLFAAYNAGPGTLEARLAGARELPKETRAYVSGIGRILGFESKSTQIAASQPASAIATLTRPDGSTVSVDSARVDSIRAAMPDEYAPGVQTVVAMGTLHQGVREDLATVTALLRRHGASV